MAWVGGVLEVAKDDRQLGRKAVVRGVGITESSTVPFVNVVPLKVSDRTVIEFVFHMLADSLL